MTNTDIAIVKFSVQLNSIENSYAIVSFIKSYRQLTMTLGITKRNKIDNTQIQIGILPN